MARFARGGQRRTALQHCDAVRRAHSGGGPSPAWSAPTRRRTVLTFAAAAALSAFDRPARAAPDAPHRLSFLNLHTGDAFNGVYREDGVLAPAAMNAIAFTLRDHRSGELHAIDHALLDTLHVLRARLETDAPFLVISGYRSPATNALLHAASSGVAARSLHMEGRAIDVRLRGLACADLRDAAIALQRGGVGYYPDSDFVHLDTGRVRRW